MQLWQDRFHIVQQFSRIERNKGLIHTYMQVIRYYLYKNLPQGRNKEH
jgi:hypothetical protein